MFDRRDLLKVTGATATAATVGVAGCLEILASRSEAKPPAYREHIVTDDDGWVGFGYVDWDELTTITGADSGGTGRFDYELDAAEVMHGYPLEGLVELVDRLTVQLAGSGIGGLLRPYPALEGIEDEQRGSETAETFESTVEEVMTVNDALVLLGSIDVEEIVAHITQTPAEDTVRREYERDGEQGEYELYTPVEADSSLGTPALAIGSDAILAAGGEEGIESNAASLETITEDGEQATDAIDEFGWLMQYADEGQIIFGGYGESTSFPQDPSEHWGNTDSIAQSFTQFVDAKGAVGSLSFEDGGTTSAALAVWYEYDTVDDSFEAALRGRLASGATERSVKVNTDRHRIRATATWGDGNETEESANESSQESD
ncbi:hypothetical protein [Halostagnicola larsenii]|nr:hypothetical protein [Halostagnicola larsenii]